MDDPFDPFGGTLFGGDPTAPATEAPPWGWVPDTWSGAAMPDMAPPPPMAGPPTADQPALPPMPPPPDASQGVPPPPAPYGAGFVPTPIGPPTKPEPGAAPVDPNALMSPSGAIETGAQRYRNDPLGDPNAEEGAKLAENMAVTDPMRFQEELIKHDQAAKAYASSERVRVEREHLQQEQSDLANYKAAMAHAQQKADVIAADASRLADTKINPERYMQGGIARNIGIAANLIIGGLNAPNTGGKNTGAEWLAQQVDRDVDAQKADIANGWKGIDTRNNLVAQEFARTGDLYHAAQTVTLAGYQAGINTLDAQMQNFDPNGTTVLRMGQAKQDLVQRQAAAIEQTRKTVFDEKYKLLQEQSKIDTNAETSRHNRAQEGIEYAKAGNEKAKTKADNEVYSPEVLQAIYKSQGIDIPLPPKAMSLGEHAKLTEAVGKAREAQAGEAATTVQGPKGKPLVDDKGTVLRLPPDQAKELNQTVALTQKFVDTAGEARRILASDPSLIDRATWQRVKSNYEKAKQDYIQIAGAKPSSREMDAVEAGFGPDFDHYTSRIASRRVGMSAIDTLVDSAVQDTGTELKQKLRYTGESVINDTSRPTGHVDTLNEKELGTLLAPPNDYSVLGGSTADDAAQLARRGGLSDEQDLILQDLGRDAKSTDTGRRSNAITELGKVVMKAQTPAVAKKAAEYLRAVTAVPSGPQIGGP